MDYKAYLKFWTGFSFKKDLITHYYENVYQIDFDALYQNGIACLIFDYDDTLTEFHGDLDNKSKDLIQSLAKKGFKIALLSNFPKHRAEALGRNFNNTNVFIQYDSNKPSIKGYKAILEHYNTTPKLTCMIGDKVGTDLFGAYLTGIKVRILVEPYSKVFKGRKPSLFQRSIRSAEKHTCKIPI